MATAQTDKAVAFAEASLGRGSVSRGRERSWDGEKAMWVVDNNWGIPMGVHGENYDKETDTRKASRQTQIWLPVGLMPLSQRPWRPWRPWARWLHSTLCPRLLAAGILGDPVKCGRRAKFSGVFNKERERAELRTRGRWASESVTRTLANVVKARGGERGRLLYRPINRGRNRHGKLERVATKENHGEGWARPISISESNEVQVQDKISLKAKTGS